MYSTVWLDLEVDIGARLTHLCIVLLFLWIATDVGELMPCNALVPSSRCDIFSFSIESKRFSYVPPLPPIPPTKTYLQLSFIQYWYWIFRINLKRSIIYSKTIKNLPITYIESSTTIAPAHLLANSILGPVFHCLCSQSYFVTRLTVRDPVGELGSDSPPPKIN